LHGTHSPTDPLTAGCEQHKGAQGREVIAPAERMVRGGFRGMKIARCAPRFALGNEVSARLGLDLAYHIVELVAKEQEDRTQHDLYSRHRRFLSERFPPTGRKRGV
jgi:hypothetical protein